MLDLEVPFVLQGLLALCGLLDLEVPFIGGVLFQRLHIFFHHFLPFVLRPTGHFVLLGGCCYLLQVLKTHRVNTDLVIGDLYLIF